jgi:hypothetical protein
MFVYIYATTEIDKIFDHMDFSTSADKIFDHMDFSTCAIYFSIIKTYLFTPRYTKLQKNTTLYISRQNWYFTL